MCYNKRVVNNKSRLGDKSRRRKDMKTNTWTTAKGAKIELVTEHKTTEEVDLDGHKATIKVDAIEIVSCKVSGKEVNAKLTSYQGKKVLDFGTTKINGVTHPLLILIPSDIYENVWGEYDRRFDAETKAELKAHSEYQQHYNKVIKAMEE